MASIGIIANPASGKDIRRLVSHATVIDNNEKTNIVERIVLGAQRFGVEKVYIMPDTYTMGYKVIEKLKVSKELKTDIEILDMKIKSSPEDTIRAAEIMENMKLGCVIVLGGDGTNRLVAKSLLDVPLIGISTGTNNVYPAMVEGTVAGMAAAVVASGRYDKNDICRRDKRIEIYMDNKLKDIALIDAVISDEIYIGAKAIWNMENIKRIIVSRCHPASIGFSAILGVNKTIGIDDDFGGSLNINIGNNKYLAPVSAGVIECMQSDNMKIIKLEEDETYIAKFKGIIAVDGEREIAFREGEKIIFRITRRGPYHVNIKKTLEAAVKDSFFKIN
jgi:predicted polyphosphate/ATP-dependent NAD kinase